MKFTAFLLALACLYVSGSTISSLSAEETQDLLQTWKLDHVFGEAFKKNKYDGYILHALTKESLAADFKEVSALHRQALLTRIQDMKGPTTSKLQRAADLPSASDFAEQHASRRLAALDTKDYNGVRIKHDKSIVTMGEKQDVQLIRTGPRQLAVTAKISADSIAVNSLTVNGKPVSGGNIEQMFEGIQNRLDNMTQALRSCGTGGGATKIVATDCKGIQKNNPGAPSGVYKVSYKSKTIQVLCDMKTAGGGWTLILRDSWKDKTVYAHGKGKPLPAENSVGQPGATKDYVGPHYMGSILGTNPLKTNAMYMYKIDACNNNDCALISDQEYSFHTNTEADVDKGFHSSPIRTVSGKQVQAGSTGARLNYFYMYPADGCGLSTDRDNGGNCWNNMFAKSRWENMPGGNIRCDLHAKCTTSGDANTLWVRERDPVDPSATSCFNIKKKHPSSADGYYDINYNGARLKVKCDMTTLGGGWTLILRDSWKDKSVYWHGKSAMQKENSFGSPEGYADYLGPHYMGSKKGTNPLKTTVDYMYTGSGCSSNDCKLISKQEYSFHTANEATVDSGFHSSPLKTLSGKQVQAGSSGARLNYFYLYPADGCGLSTDRDNGGNCWNNMFAKSRWENMPGGQTRCDYHVNGACNSKYGDANMLWVRPR